MEHLSEEKIQNYLNGKLVYQELLQISAHLLNCRNNCLKRLNEIDPNFLKIADRLEAEYEIMIKEGMHYPEDEIRLYVNKSYPLEKRLQMNTHFKCCPICAEKLKEINPDYLFEFIEDKLAGNKLKETLEVVSETDNFSFGINFLVPASLLIILPFSIISLWMFSGSREVDQAKIETGISEKTFEEKEVPFDNTNGEQKLNQNSSKRKTTSANQGTPDKTAVETQVKLLAEKEAGKEKQVKRFPINQTQKRTPVILTNRSLNNNCESTHYLAVSPNNEVITEHQPTLSWKKVKNAISYQIYLADTMNNLIEETKVVQTNTTYKINSTLELNKKYEWKVVATVENGKQIYGETATFTVGQKKRKMSKPKLRNNETRCLKTPN